MVEDLMVCCRCDFYNFNQVHQCEQEGETCKWLLSLKEKAKKWDKWRNIILLLGNDRDVRSKTIEDYLRLHDQLEAAKKLLNKIIDGVDFYTCTQILISTPVIEELRIVLEGEK